MRIGSLFSGYGGLDMAVASVFDAEVTWHVEYDKAPSRILAHHYPDVPNYGDVTTLDFTTVEPVDILTGGYPCQPFSHAGKRKGTEDERHLWPHVLRAIREMGPRLAVLENVRGHLSLGFDIVLADLADLGWSARWGVVRASDAGAPHQRARLFIVAYPDSVTDRSKRVTCRMDIQEPTTAGTGAVFSHLDIRTSGMYGHDETSSDADAANTYSIAWGNSRQDSERLRVQFLGLAQSATDATRTKWGRTEQQHMGAAFRSASESREHSGTHWGNYAPAIARWERVIGRPAPAPTEPGRTGAPRLNPAFVEWMMGLPAGHVTEPAIGISRNDQLKALGNGVVPQQAALALSILIPQMQEVMV